jgi:hypothetical protein
MMEQRVCRLNERPPRTGGRYVLDLCRWNRRIESNHALARSGMERKTGVSAYLREIEHLEHTGEELHE